MSPNDTPPQAQHPFANMIEAAKNGQVNIKMDLEQFVYLDRDCDYFLGVIGQIKRMMDQVSRQETWGLGEQYHDGDKQLISGQKVVEWFRTKSRAPSDTDTKASSNSVYAAMVSHEQAVRDIQQTYRLIRQRITDQDAAAAAKYKQLEATLPQQPPVTPPAFKATGLPPAKK